ncbi:NLR family CARD domain-containing protein 3-like [Diretmus argenteus]
MWKEIQTYCAFVGVPLESLELQADRDKAHAPATPPRKRPAKQPAAFDCMIVTSTLGQREYTAATTQTPKQKWASQLFYPVLDTLLGECRDRFSPQSIAISKSVDAVFSCDYGGAESLINQIHQERPDSPVPSCVSMKSDWSMRQPIAFKDGPHSTEQSDVGSSVIDKDLLRAVREEISDQMYNTSIYPYVNESLQEDQKFQCVFEGIAKAENPTLLNQIYTELYITEGGSGEVNEEHEIRQIETASRKPVRRETTITCEDIFKPLPGREEPIRTVMTRGVAGIGKTVLTQKFTLDWAEDQTNHNIHFMFPFTFRELNLLKGKEFSLVELLHHFFIENKEAEICSFDEFQVVLIFDGLDECRLPLDFHNNHICTDITESTSVDVLLTNLIKGNLLPSARVWITSRPAAANQIPPECVDRVTEVRGFNDPQKEEYFMKRITDEELARRIISHIKRSRSIHIMCHIPVFCWIINTVLNHVLATNQRAEMPNTLTKMYIHFLVVQTKQGNVKYHGRAETDPHWTTETSEMIVSLGKLSFEQLEKGNLIYYESDLTECGIDIRSASVYSGVFTQIFKLDLFLRFLLGLSLETNQTNQETVQYIKEKIRENPSPERSINLFHCLNELNDRSLVEEIQRYLSSGRLSRADLSPAQWSALVFILLSSEEELEVFDQKQYSASEEGNQ